jgi:hypothetical protein
VSDRQIDDLESEREFLLTSLEDLEREHAAGDVTDEDYETLRAGYTERAARVLRAGEAPTPAPSRPSKARGFRRALGRRRVRRVLAVAGTASLLIGIGLYAASVAGVRLPGQSVTGSVTVPKATEIAQQLVEASTLANAGEIDQAITLYSVILTETPNQPEALTYRGWLERLSGLRAHSAVTVRAGDTSLADAARVAPHYADAQGLDGIALFTDAHNETAALSHYRTFLADRPSKTLLGDLGAEMAADFSLAHEPVPSALKLYVSKTGAK